MIKDVDLLFDLDDVGLVPQGTSAPFSISECSLMVNNKLPIFVYSNDIGMRNDVTYIIRKEEPLAKRFALMYSTFVSMDFEDFYKYIVNNETKVKISDETFYISLDINEVGLPRVADVIKAAKKCYNDQLILMVNRITYVEQYNLLSDLRINYAMIGNTDEYGKKIQSVDGFVTPYGYLIELINERITRGFGADRDFGRRDRRPVLGAPRRGHALPDLPDGIADEDIDEEDEEARVPSIPCEPIFVPYAGERPDRIIKAMALGCRYITLHDESYVDKICDVLMSALYKGRCKTLKEFRNTAVHMISGAVLSNN